MKNYWSKLKLGIQQSKKERFNYLMARIDEAIVGDSDLSEKINNIIERFENLFIPTKLSELENDTGFIEEHQSLDDYISKSSTNGLICNDGSVDTTKYLTNEDVADVVRTSNVDGLIRNDGSIDVNSYLTSHQDITSKVDKNELSNVALTGDYSDLTNKPVIPDVSDVVRVNSTRGLLMNDGSVDTTQYLSEHQDITGKVDKVDLKNIAFTGDYDDLTNSPNIPSKISQLDNDADFIDETVLNDYIPKSSVIGLVRNDGTIDDNDYLTEHQDITSKVNRSDLSSVALSGDYNDLTNAPIVPTRLSELDNDSDFLTEHQNLDNYIIKSTTNGLIRNDGSVDTTNYLSEHQDISGKIDRTELFKNGVFTTTNTNSRGSVAKIWNESDGGGTQFTDNSSGVVSFVGVNEGSRDGDIYVQIYSKNKSTNNGVRLNFNPNGAFYTVGTAKTWTTDNEIATKGDLTDLELRISALESLNHLNENDVGYDVDGDDGVDDDI